VRRSILVIFICAVLAWTAVGAIGLLIYHAIDC
jgi:hypothetical protein